MTDEERARSAEAKWQQAVLVKLETLAEALQHIARAMHSIEQHLEHLAVHGRAR